MAKVDIINTTVEELYQKLKRAEVHPLVMEIIIQLHEQQNEIQHFCNELIRQNQEMITAMKLSGELQKQLRGRLDKLALKFSDPAQDQIKSEEINREST